MCIRDRCRLSPVHGRSAARPRLRRVSACLAALRRSRPRVEPPWPGVRDGDPFPLPPLDQAYRACDCSLSRVFLPPMTGRKTTRKGSRGSGSLEDWEMLEVYYGARERARDPFDCLDLGDDQLPEVVDIVRGGSNYDVVGASDILCGVDAVDVADLFRHLCRLAHFGLN